MKGFVEISKENGMDLIEKCRKVLNTTPIMQKISCTRFSFKKMRNITVEYDVCPYWYGDKEALKNYFNSLELMINKPDKVNLSLRCYENIILLSNGSDKTNPIFIINY